MIVNNPISFQGQVTRAQDLSTIKQNDNNRGAFEQITIQKAQDDQKEAKSKQVLHKDDIEDREKRHDAKEKGSNQYLGDGGKHRGKQEERSGGRGPQKTTMLGFDVKV